VLVLFTVLPNLADLVYRQGIFQLFRISFDNTINLLPFPLLYLELILLPLILFYYAKKFKGKIARLLLFPLNAMGWFVGLFFWLWGFNYSCSPLYSNLNTEPLSEEELFIFGRDIIDSLSKDSPFMNNINFSFDNYYNEIQQAVKVQIQDAGVLTCGNPTFHSIGVSGFMRRLGIAGIYIPYTGQAHGDQSFLSKTRAFICAHELSHAYGVTSEAEADFISYLALTENKKGNMELRYAGNLELLRTIRYQLGQMHESRRHDLDFYIPPSVMYDIQMIRRNGQLYPEFFPGMQENLNDTYLKALGIQDGVLNYDRFVDLAYAYHKKKHN